MDPAITNLATSVMSVLLPYVSKGAEEFARFAGEAAFKKAKSLIDTLKAKLSGDKEASEALSHFEEKPERYQQILKDILQEKLEKDKGLADELGKLLRDLGPSLKVLQEMKEGSNVTGVKADKITGGDVSVTQKIDKASNVTGVEIKDIGH